jgi:DNA-binding PadR family transcriptional regulator
MSRTQYQLLSLLVKERTGREVADLFRDRFRRTIARGTMYTTLGRMEEEGWVKSRDSRGQDRRVRHFKLTGAGARALNEAQQEFSDLAALPEVTP